MKQGWVFVNGRARHAVLDPRGARFLWGEVNPGDKEARVGGSTQDPPKGSRDTTQPGPLGQGRRRLPITRAAERSWGRKLPLCAAGLWGWGATLPGQCALPRPPPACSGSLGLGVCGGVVGDSWLSAFPHGAQDVQSGWPWGQGQAWVTRAPPKHRVTVGSLFPRTPTSVPGNHETELGVQPQKIGSE